MVRARYSIVVLRCGEVVLSGVMVKWRGVWFRKARVWRGGVAYSKGRVEHNIVLQRYGEALHCNAKVRHSIV